MARPPEISIDPAAFWHDPYPALADMRARSPIAYVPALGATLLTKRDDIFTCEKNVAIFSSEQPGGLMTTLMGENMMRKDAGAHQAERKQMFPSISPVTVRDHWRQTFARYADEILDSITTRTSIDLVSDYAMPVSANALRELTGLITLSAAEIDSVSQGMIDGCANYTGDKDIEARCHRATKKIDEAIDQRWSKVDQEPDYSILSVLKRAGQSEASIRANIKLVISGGQNEPRDAIAGVVWALLTHPKDLELVRSGKATWLQAFEEYARWISPIGMSPRRVAIDHTFKTIDFEADARVFLMFSSANRDEDIFESPQCFDVQRDTSRAVSFGAGPHFCAGAAASRCLIADVALPLLFERFPRIKLTGAVPFGGWAFRGPLSVPVELGSPSD